MPARRRWRARARRTRSGSRASSIKPAMCAAVRTTAALLGVHDGLCVAADAAAQDRLGLERPAADGERLAELAHLVEIGARVDERCRAPCRRRCRRSSGTRRRWSRERRSVPRSWTLQQPERRAGGTEAVVDADDGDARRARGSIASSAVTPSRLGAVADARRHRDHGRGGEPADDAGQRTLHAGDDDDRVGGGQLVGVRQQPVDAGDADVGDASSGRTPWASSTAAHSSATGRSAVPAVMTSTCSRRSAVSGRHTSVLPLRRRRGCASSAAAAWSSSTRVSSTGRVPAAQQLADDRGALVGRLARAVDRLGQPWRSARWWSTRAKPRSANGQPTEHGDGFVGIDDARAHVVEQISKGGFVHVTILARRGHKRQFSVESGAAHRFRIGFLGPHGTFTEQALLTQPDLARGRARADRVDPRRARAPPKQARSTSASCRSRTRSRARSTSRSTRWRSTPTC